MGEDFKGRPAVTGRRAYLQSTSALLITLFSGE
jgi:hypothetical protein